MIIRSMNYEFVNGQIILNTLILFWLTLGQWKTSKVVFLKKKNEFSCLFGHNIISNSLYQTIRNDIGKKRQLNSFFFFIKRQLSQFSLDPIWAKKSIKVLNKGQKICKKQSFVGLLTNRAKKFKFAHNNKLLCKLQKIFLSTVLELYLHILLELFKCTQYWFLLV